MNAADEALQRSASAVPVVTPWTPGQTPEWMEDAEKSRLFAEMAIGMAGKQYPWLIALLLATKARVVAMPRHFLIEAPAGSENWIPVPELSMNLHMVPWQTEDETPQ